MDRESIREMLMAVPGSYDDFVEDTVGWMESREDIRDAIINQLRVKPLSDTDDLTKILWEYLGIGEPLELIDDEYEDESQYVNTAARAAY